MKLYKEISASKSLGLSVIIRDFSVFTLIFIHTIIVLEGILMVQSSVPPSDQHKIQSEVDDILSTLPTETETEILLPSKGKFYGDSCPHGKIKIRPLTFSDEKALLSTKNAKNNDPVSLILSRCVSGVETGNLLFMDKMFIVMKIREISYGDEYLVNVKCSECVVENPLRFILSQLDITYIPDDFEDPRELDLPVLKKKVKVRLPRVHDENYMVTPERMLDNLWRFIVEIDGNSKSTVISKVITQLPSADVHTIVNALTVNDYGIETKARFDCDKCGFTNHIALPLTENFFSVN